MVNKSNLLRLGLGWSQALGQATARVVASIVAIQVAHRFRRGVAGDDGGTFNRVRVSRGKSNRFRDHPDDRFDYGDYVSVVFHGGVIYPFWADNSDSIGNLKREKVNGNAVKYSNYEIHTRQIKVFEN